MLYPDFNELIGIGSRPGRLAMPSARRTSGALFGNSLSAFRGQGLTFEEVREYRNGDDIRNIDWRVTARRDKPHLKVFTEDRERTVIMCIDANAAMQFGTRGTFKSIQAARAAAWLGSLANESRDRLGCVLFGDTLDGIELFRPLGSRRTLWRALRTLSSPRPSRLGHRVSADEAMDRVDEIAPTGSLVFLISDFDGVSTPSEASVLRLRQRRDLAFVRINDPADGVIPPAGPLNFGAGDRDPFLVDTKSPAGRQAYRTAWENNRRNVAGLAAKNGIPIIDLHTNRDIRDDLIPAIQRLRRRRRS